MQNLQRQVEFKMRNKSWVQLSSLSRILWKVLLFYPTFTFFVVL